MNSLFYLISKMTTICYSKWKANTDTQKHNRISKGTAVKYMMAELYVSTKYGEFINK